MDWRVWVIVGTAVVAVLGTVFVYLNGWGLDPATHFGAVFAGWVGGLALFVIAGLMVAIVSLVRPENESFDARARILFRRQAGKHIDYIVAKIKEVLEHYAETTTNKITIHEYDLASNKFRITSEGTASVRSYLDDVESTYKSEIKLNDVTAPPEGGRSNRLVFARVAGTPIGAAENFATSVSRPISCLVDRDGACEVKTLFDYWLVGTTELNGYTPRRYTQILTLECENLTDQTIQVKLTLDGTNWFEHQLIPGTVKQVLELKDLKPGIKAYTYTLLPP